MKQSCRIFVTPEFLYQLWNSLFSRGNFLLWSFCQKTITVEKKRIWLVLWLVLWHACYQIQIKKIFVLLGQHLCTLLTVRHALNKQFSVSKQKYKSKITFNIFIFVYCVVPLFCHPMMYRFVDTAGESIKAGEQVSIPKLWYIGKISSVSVWRGEVLNHGN